MITCACTFSIMATKYRNVNGVVDYAEAVTTSRFAYYINWFTTMIYYPAMTSVLAWVSARYTGVIFGEEIDYDPITNKIIIDFSKFYDKYVKQGNDAATVEKYIINSYKVIMTRGIKGCYFYACNKNMREYLARFIKEEKK